MAYIFKNCGFDTFDDFDDNGGGKDGKLWLQLLSHLLLLLLIKIRTFIFVFFQVVVHLQIRDILCGIM